MRMQLKFYKRSINSVNVQYYNDLKQIVNVYTKLICEKNIDSTYKNKLLHELLNESNRLGITSTYKFFNKYRSSIGSHLRRDIDIKIGLNPEDELIYTLNMNRYNFERLVSIIGLKKIRIELIEKVPKYSDVVDDSKVILMLSKGDNEVSDTVLVKHGKAIEFYDMYRNRTVAFKNYNRDETFGQWDEECEILAFKAITLYKILEARNFNKIVKSETLPKKHLDRIKDIFDTTYSTWLSDYEREIIALTIQKLKLEDIIDDVIIKNIMHRSILQLTHTSDRIAEAFEAFELHKIEREIIRLENQERLQTELLKKKEEEKRQRELKNTVTISKEEIEYRENWGEYESEHIRLTTNINSIDNNISTYLPKEFNKRLRTILIRSNAIKFLNLDKFSSNEKFRVYNKIVHVADKIINKNILDGFIENNDKTGLEEYIRGIVGATFIRLVDRKDISGDMNDGLMKLYYNTKETIGKTSLLHNMAEKRGTLIAYNNYIIDGGNNKENQCSLELRLVDNALNDLCCAIGDRNPNSSILNKFIEKEVLYEKSQRVDVFNLMPEAINTYILNRDRDNFKKLTNFDNSRKSVKIYIPCEYNAYLREVFKHNQDNKLLKRNYTAVLNIIIYEYLMMRFNKSYI